NQYLSTIFPTLLSIITCSSKGKWMLPSILHCASECEAEARLILFNDAFHLSQVTRLKHLVPIVNALVTRNLLVVQSGKFHFALNLVVERSTMSGMIGAGKSDGLLSCKVPRLWHVERS